MLRQLATKLKKELPGDLLFIVLGLLAGTAVKMFM